MIFFNTHTPLPVTQSNPLKYPFDHLVIIGRDELGGLSQKFVAQGFLLTPLAHHNLGSSNQLMMLDTTYIELLGWESGTTPQRAEIANQAIGLDALVFRTENAQQTYTQLKDAGFAINPVQDLSRKTEFLGKSVIAEFKTVRFSEQPVTGIRIYFCEHLTPEYVWQNQWMHHQNQLDCLSKITLASSAIEETAQIFYKLLNLEPKDIDHHENSINISLPNLELAIEYSKGADKVQIVSALIKSSASSTVDLVIKADLFNSI
jgi:Glyoxalase-like domain